MKGNFLNWAVTNLFIFFIILFCKSWNIVDLQCFRYTAKCFFSVIGYCKVLNIVTCSIQSSCCLSILYIVAAVHGVATSQTRLSNFTFTFHFSLSCLGEGNGNPLQWSCLENARDGGAWWAAVCGVAQSRTWLKRLSSSSSAYLLIATSLFINLLIYSLHLLPPLVTVFVFCVCKSLSVLYISSFVSFFRFHV